MKLKQIILALSATAISALVVSQKANAQHIAPMICKITSCTLIEVFTNNEGNIGYMWRDSLGNIAASDTYGNIIIFSISEKNPVGITVMCDMISRDFKSRNNTKHDVYSSSEKNCLFVGKGDRQKD